MLGLYFQSFDEQWRTKLHVKGQRTSETLATNPFPMQKICSCKKSPCNLWIYSQTQTSSPTRHVYDKRRDEGLIRPRLFQSWDGINISLAITRTCRNFLTTLQNFRDTPSWAPLQIDSLSCRFITMKIFIKHADKTSKTLYFVQIGSERDSCSSHWERLCYRW